MDIDTCDIDISHLHSIKQTQHIATKFQVVGIVCIVLVLMLILATCVLVRGGDGDGDGDGDDSAGTWH